jgi:hypothetical protein
MLFSWRTIREMLWLESRITGRIMQIQRVSRVVCFGCVLFASSQLYSQESPLIFSEPNPQRYELSARASQIDSRAKEHAEIDFVFSKQDRPSDLERATVDTRVAPRGRLVIWLMGYSGPLFDRLSGYGLHAIQVHYANGWFGRLSRQAPAGDDKYLGRIRLEAATGEDFSTAVEIPKADACKSGHSNSCAGWQRRTRRAAGTIFYRTMAQA